VLEKLDNLNHRSPSIVNEAADGNNPIGARDLASMSVDELWSFREAIDAILAAKIRTELNELSRQLDRLSPRDKAAKRLTAKRSKAAARNYPTSRPKYQNPERPFETWSGRGRRPYWLNEQLNIGKLLEEFSAA